MKPKVAGRGKGGVGLSPNTVRNVKKVLSAAFNYAVAKGIIADNPVSKVRVPKVEEETASLTPEEAEAFISVRDCFWYGDAFVFQLRTGLRPQELIALFWEDIDFEQGTVRVERACKWKYTTFTGFGPPKNKKKRAVDLSPDLLELLRAHLEKQRRVIAEREAKGESYGEPMIQEWVEKSRPRQASLYASARLIFPKADGRVPNRNGPYLEFKEMLRRAEITGGGPSNYRWYDLRHSYATLLINAGVPVPEVAARMGDSVSTVLSTYAHALKSKQIDASAQLAKLIPIRGNEPVPQDETGPKPEDDPTDPETEHDK